MCRLAATCSSSTAAGLAKCPGRSNSPARGRSCCSPGGRSTSRAATAGPFFFDQGGRLAARFGLAATPVLIEQEGLRLRLTEVPVPDRGNEP